MAPFARKAVESRPLPFWSFVMLAANVETVSAFLHEVKTGGRPFSTLAVWYAMAPYVQRVTGAIT